MQSKGTRTIVSTAAAHRPQGGALRQRLRVRHIQCSLNSVLPECLLQIGRADQRTPAGIDDEGALLGLQTTHKSTSHVCLYAAEGQFMVAMIIDAARASCSVCTRSHAYAHASACAVQLRARMLACNAVL